MKQTPHNEAVITRKAIHAAKGYSVSEVTEVVNGIRQKRYQILDAYEKPLTSQSSSLDYVMTIFRRYTS
jgi:hypothetical protein